MLGLLAPGVGMGGTPTVAPSFTWIFPRGGSTYVATPPLRVLAAEGHVAQARTQGSHVAQARMQDSHVAQVEAMEGLEQ